ncbi:plasmid mobilization protein [Yeosuana marina]|uniref:plasmid mobilization protein n=1 Tax=Yeosuana marina TaxID=1565536 RepID=UPI0030EB1BDC
MFRLRKETAEGKSKKYGLSVSEYIRRSVFEKEITERFSEEHIQIYKMLIK